MDTPNPGFFQPNTGHGIQVQIGQRLVEVAIRLQNLFFGTHNAVIIGVWLG